jgi:ribosomal protein S14
MINVFICSYMSPLQSRQPNAKCMHHKCKQNGKQHGVLHKLTHVCQQLCLRSLSKLKNMSSSDGCSLQAMSVDCSESESEVEADAAMMELEANDVPGVC